MDGSLFLPAMVLSLGFRVQGPGGAKVLQVLSVHLILLRQANEKPPTTKKKLHRGLRFVPILDSSLGCFSPNHCRILNAQGRRCLAGAFRHLSQHKPACCSPSNLRWEAQAGVRDHHNVSQKKHVSNKRSMFCCGDTTAETPHSAALLRPRQLS